MSKATDKMLDQIRKIIASTPGSEKEVYEELLAEAEGWQMRLDEIEEEEEEKEE